MRILSISTFGLVLCIALASFVLTACGDSKKETSQQKKPEKAVVQEAAAETPVSSDPMENKGIGPVKSVELGEIDAVLAAKGKELFNSNCGACHKFDQKQVGPALAGITERRSPEWIMNMILNPKEMTEKDPIAKELLETYLTQMIFQNLTQDDARAVLEYFREVDSQN